MIIGLTGPYCSGKDTVADYLVSRKGFVHYSLSDVLRDELKCRGMEITRANLLKIGVELRSKFGHKVLAEMVLEKCLHGKDYVITSIRHSAEVIRLKETGNFFLVGLDAPPMMRFERMKKRNREQDPGTFEEFVALEARESQSDGPGQQVNKCCGLADEILINDTDIDGLYVKVENLLRRLKVRNEHF